ncbi:hypothetical protein JIN84_20050 [Luteolibacter yonseiensis]|uniref:Uncharacterized protein n=1 Tax=Luteolibacter yonseiensis TaxID=1144680 RepID=A0A934VD97_9BACT|nr:hypothetical protein [Luteolibacter yonseiensis]MBK1817925.1 hypothetical protein [Luteolibacter yonseiensis]
MDAPAPTGGRRTGPRRWGWIILLLILPAVALLLMNLALASPWSCRWLASHIQRRCGGLDVRVEGVTVTPWSGVSIHRLRILQPAPLRSVVKEHLLEVRMLQVAPIWSAWLRGRLETRSIAFDAPRLVLPVELISHLAKSGPPPPPVPVTQPPAMAASPPAPTPPVAAPPTIPTPASNPEGTRPEVPVPKPLPVPTSWLHVRNASFALVRAGSDDALIEFAATTGSIPIAGDPAGSVLKIGSISAQGKPFAMDATAALAWTSPLLSLKPADMEVSGYKFQLGAQLALFSGLPLQIEAVLPPQALKPVDLPFDGQVTAEGVSANARFRGLLSAPSTWQGDLVAQSLYPTVRAAGQEAKFDRASLVTVLRGNVLSCMDARLTSDNLSVLGNATLLADGRLAGVARLVATPETATMIVNKVFPNHPGPPALTPLSTPQRSAFDLEAFGNISQIFLRLGQQGPIVNLHP